MSTATADQLELTFTDPEPAQPETGPSEADLPLTVHLHRALATLETQALTLTDLDTLRIAYRTLTVHQPNWDAHRCQPDPNCAHCGAPNPCPHVTAIAAALNL